MMSFLQFKISKPTLKIFLMFSQVFQTLKIIIRYTLDHQSTHTFIKQIEMYDTIKKSEYQTPNIQQIKTKRKLNNQNYMILTLQTKINLLSQTIQAKKYKQRARKTIYQGIIPSSSYKQNKNISLFSYFKLADLTLKFFRKQSITYILYYPQYTCFNNQIIDKQQSYFLPYKIKNMRNLKKTLGKTQFKCINKKNLSSLNRKNTTWIDLANEQLQRSVDCLSNANNSELTLAQSFYKTIAEHYHTNKWAEYQKLERQLLQKYGDFNKWNIKNKEKSLNDIIEILTQLYHMQNSNEAKSILQICISKLEQSLAQYRLKIKNQSLRDYEIIAKRLISTRKKHRNHIKPLGKSDITIGTTMNQSQKCQELKQVQTSDDQPHKKQNQHNEKYRYKQKLDELLREYKEQNSIKKIKQKNYDYNAILDASKFMIKKRSDLTDSRDIRTNRNPQQAPYNLMQYAQI